MMAEALPESVQRLLRDRLKSFEQLEVLLLLHRRGREDWTVTSASAEVGLTEERTGEALLALMKYRLVTRDGGVYRYAPVDAAAARAIDDLAIACQERRAAVMSQMSSNAIERIRSGSLQTFADSFVFRRKKDDG